MRLLALTFGITFASLPLRAAPATWTNSLLAAQARAKAESRLVLINFTGSDWCVWCKRLKAEVFAKPEFNVYAQEKLALVEIDFPMHSPQPPALQQANAALAQRFDIKGYPAIVLLDRDGRELGRLGYMPGGPKPFLSEIEKLGGNKLRRPVATSGGRVSARETPNTEGLELRGLSGPKHRRVALINGVSLFAGEGAVIPLADRRAKVKCLEIRERSVVVQVDQATKPVELKMRDVQ